MTDTLFALIVDEGKWPAVSMVTAGLVAGSHFYLSRRSNLSDDLRVLAAMNAYFATFIGVMAFGHLLAVAVKHAAGVLEGSRLLFYAIGVALAAPSWWLVARTWRVGESPASYRSTSTKLNAWLIATLLLLGLHNAPLALPALLNVGYATLTRRSMRIAVVALAVALNVSLFVGSVVFFASGQSFEQFRGID